jgi:spore maturation protein CgeB
MKIVVFGLTISSTWGNGHATLWRGLCRALHHKHHQVVFYERDVPYYAGARDFYDIPGGELILYSDWPDTRLRAMHDIADADVAIITSYCADGMAAGELVFSAGRALSVFYDMDTPVTLARIHRGETLSYIGPGGLTEFDLVLSYTGGRALEQLHRQLGARLVVPLYGHVDPNIYRPGEAAAHYRADLSYLGTFALDRQAALESFFVEPARRRPDRRFLLGGAQYPDDFPWTMNMFFVRHLPACEHPAFFASSRLTLNITRREMAEMGWCPSGRLFEATACGAAVISDGWPGLDAFFRPGEEVLLALNTDSTMSALELDDAEFRRIGAAARERTLTEHTSERRSEELIKAFELARTCSWQQATARLET